MKMLSGSCFGLAFVFVVSAASGGACQRDNGSVDDTPGDAGASGDGEGARESTGGSSGVVQGGTTSQGDAGGSAGNAGSAGNGQTPAMGNTDDSGQVIVDDITDPGLSETPNAKLVFSQTFDALSLGDPWLKACKWKKHARVEATCGVKGSPCLHIKQDPFNAEPSLFPLPPQNQRPPYPAGSAGQCYPHYTNTATDVVQDIVEVPSALEYSLSYDVYFQAGYDWARGGKLPGLSAKEWDSGCSKTEDGLQTDPGPHRWSVRVMWREGGANELYVYEQSRTPGLCGARLRTRMPFQTGKWRAVTVYVKLNSAAAARDGVAALYFDGTLAQSITGVQFRGTTEKASLIRNVFFSTFFGGNEAKRLYCKGHPSNATYCQPPDPKIETTWVPKDVAHVLFDNITVHEGLHIRRAPGTGF